MEDKTAHFSRLYTTKGGPPATSTDSSASSEQSCENDCSIPGCDRCTTPSVHDSEACSLEACLNPDGCESVECCREEACIRPSDLTIHPGSSTGDHLALQQHDFPDFLNYDTTDPNDLIPCQWLETDHQCTVSAQSIDALSQHVFQNHIEQQALLPCEWGQCDQTVESQQLVEHVSQKHHPDQYVCLWQGCGYSFSSDEELAAHMSALHCTKLDCHWGGCEVINVDPGALKSHINDAHINMRLAEAFHQNMYGDSLSASPSTVSGQHSSQILGPSSLSSPAPPQSPHFQPPRRAHGSMSDSTAHTCFWTTDLSVGVVCAATFHHENDLQAHVEEAHINSLTARNNPHGNAIFICKWQGCKAEGTPHNGKDKLRKHTYTHTRYYLFECGFCNQRFHSKSHYENHERTHTGEKPFKCDTCSACFPSKESLRNHTRTHTGEKPLKCETCGFECADSSNLSKHRKIHKSPIHFCSICNKGFCRPDSLKRHMVHQHNKSAGQKRPYEAISNA